jgi:hypothetical protein
MSDGAYKIRWYGCLSIDMKSFRSVLVVVFLAAYALACGADEVKLEPNAILRLDFPNLPETLVSKFTGEKQVARLTAQLPNNYSSSRTFPLFIFLHGGHGGNGEPHPVTREIIGPRDFVCVTLPLFKRSFDKEEGALVSMDDFGTIANGYEVMLHELMNIVPNITPERSALGGFSNGAHTVAVLLAGQDEFTLRHFRSFFFVEGGSPLAANALQKLAMKRNRFLVLTGDQLKGVATHEALILVARSLEYSAQERQLDLTSIVMRGAGHEVPPKYAARIGQWVRGEKITEADTQ